MIFIDDVVIDMVMELYNELKNLANKNLHNCISEDILLARANEAGLPILEISKLTDRLVNDGVKILSSEDYKKAVEDTKKVNPDVDVYMQEILELFNNLTEEKRKICIRILNDKMMDSDDTFYFNCNIGIGGQGIGRVDDKGFWVMKGSYIYPKISSYLPADVFKAREIYTNVIDEYGILQEDVLLSSPSNAAAFVCGKNADGLSEWKNKDGIPLKELSDRLAVSSENYREEVEDTKNVNSEVDADIQKILENKITDDFDNSNYEVDEDWDLNEDEDWDIDEDDDEDWDTDEDDDEDWDIDEDNDEDWDIDEDNDEEWDTDKDDDEEWDTDEDDDEDWDIAENKDWDIDEGDNEYWSWKWYWNWYWNEDEDEWNKLISILMSSHDSSFDAINKVAQLQSPIDKDDIYQTLKPVFGVKISETISEHISDCTID